MLVRDDDIPNLVTDGVCDFGIVGTNLLQERKLTIEDKRGQTPLQANERGLTPLQTEINIIRYLGFAACRLAIAVPKTFAYQSISSLANCRVATSYPNLLAQYCQEKNLSIDIINLSGSVEIAPRLGIADAICDLVSTGATLEANNLQEVETIFKSQAVLIQSAKPLSDAKKHTADIFQHRVEGAELANGSKYIMLHAPKSALSTIVTLLPGAERPTVLELQGDQEKIAIHALCRENVFWETMEKLKMAGASSILVLPVEKMLC